MHDFDGRRELHLDQLQATPHPPDEPRSPIGCVLVMASSGLMLAAIVFAIYWAANR